MIDWCFKFRIISSPVCCSCNRPMGDDLTLFSAVAAGGGDGRPGQPIIPNVAKVADSFLSEPKRGCASWWVLFSGDRAENEIEMTKQKIRNFLRSQAGRVRCWKRDICRLSASFWLRRWVFPLRAAFKGCGDDDGEVFLLKLMDRLLSSVVFWLFRLIVAVVVPEIVCCASVTIMNLVARGRQGCKTDFLPIDNA